MLKLIFFTTIIAYVYGLGELYILNHPNGITFKGHQRLYESDLPEVYSLALGFSIEHGSSWTGMYLTSPFSLAEAVLTVTVDGIANLEGVGHSFPLKTDFTEDETFGEMQKRINDHNPVGESKVINIDLADSVKTVNTYKFLNGIQHLKKSKDGHFSLKYDVEEDRKFLHEINLLNAISKEIESGVIKRNFQPNFYRFRCGGLHALSDLHGDNSTATNEGKKLLVDSINRLSQAISKAYDGKVLVTVVTSDVSHTRRARSVPEVKAGNGTANMFWKNLNIAPTYGRDYPVIFNLILWFGVAMVFALLAICLAIGNMDPGRDSIIYRMTSTRMKKDN